MGGDDIGATVVEDAGKASAGVCSDRLELGEIVVELGPTGLDGVASDVGLFAGVLCGEGTLLPLLEDVDGVGLVVVRVLAESLERGDETVRVVDALFCNGELAAEGVDVGIGVGEELCEAGRGGGGRMGRGIAADVRGDRHGAWLG